MAIAAVKDYEVNIAAGESASNALSLEDGHRLFAVLLQADFTEANLAPQFTLDVVANRCFKAGVAFPAEWKAYVDALRVAYHAEEVIELPSPPKNEDGSIAYPAGT